MAMWNPWRGCKNVVLDFCIAIFINVSSEVMILAERHYSGIDIQR